MKAHLISITAFVALSLPLSCGGPSENGTEDSAQLLLKTAATQVEQPDPSLPEVTIEMTGNDLMKFNVTEIKARPAQKVTVTLKNIGTMPKVSMGHNFVLLTSDMDPNKFVELSGIHMARDFIAPELENKVIAHTKLLGPGESDTISFAAPRAPGIYHYICSFPGHCAIGMRGALTVQ